MPDLLNLENNWTKIGETPWDHEKFEKELPGKWELSVHASFDGKIIGYAICSIDKDVAKLNKILVDKQFQGQGVAGMLWNEFVKKAKLRGLRKIEFKVYVNNDAVNFYKKHGCLFYRTELGDDNRLRYLVKYVFKTEKRVSHSKPTIDVSDAKSIIKAMESGDIATGNITKEFVKSVAKYVGRRYGIATINGLSALHISLRALDIKEDDEVIIPSYTCSSILSAVNQCRATPIIADINEKDDYNISFEDVKRKITPKTKAIILIHNFGKPVKDIERFMELGVPVIEDTALSIGASHNGRKAGSFGILSIFSFYATKMMTTGTGGMILTDDKILFDRLKDLTTYDNRKEMSENYNYKMSDLQASLGISQLAKLDDFIKRRKDIARRYSLLFKEAKTEFVIPSSAENDENIFFRYIVKHEKKDDIIKNAKEKGIEASMPVQKPLHAYLGLPDNKFPNTSDAYNKAISIPLFPSLADEEIEDIASVFVNMENTLKLEDLGGKK